MSSRKMIYNDISMEKIVLPEGDSWILRGELPLELRMNKKTFQELWDMHPEEYEDIIMMGRHVKTPRWQKSYGQSYYYTGLMHDAAAIEHPYLQQLQKWVNEHSG